MLSKRLNIMLYSNSTGERIILPVNPENIEIKYEKNTDTYDILGFGQVNAIGNRLPLAIKLKCILPDDESELLSGLNLLFMNGNDRENLYSIKNAVYLFKRWAQEKTKVRLVIDEELNLEGVIKYFSDTIRESTTSRKCEIEFLEYRNPASIKVQSSGLLRRIKNSISPKTILMKNGDTIYKIAQKIGKDFMEILKKNNEKDANKEMAGKVLVIGGE